MINFNNIKINTQQVKAKSEETKPKESEQKAGEDARQETPVRVDATLAGAVLGIKKHTPKSDKTDENRDFINGQKFAEKLTEDEKSALANILDKNDEESGYMRKLITLVSEDKVHRDSLICICEHGEITSPLKADLDKYFEAKEAGIPEEEAFVPTRTSKQDGITSSEVGDVFGVEGSEEIYIKTAEDTARKLQLDRATFLKLFPPCERFLTSQGETGDCYLLSTMNTIHENPKSRVALYSCFKQKGNDVEVSIPSGEIRVICPDCKLPEGTDESKYSNGAEGIRLLEHAYGKHLEQQRFEEYGREMGSLIGEAEDELADTEPGTKEYEKAKKTLDGLNTAQNKFSSLIQDPNHTVTLVTDDYGELVIGRRGPVYKDCSKIDKDYKSPGDYYRGYTGGWPEDVMKAFGFHPVNYVAGENDAEIKSILTVENPDDYIYAAATYSDDSEIEKEVAEDYSVYSGHAYRLAPKTDSDGNRVFEVNNPWNTSHAVTMTLEKLKEYFESFAIARVDGGRLKQEESD